MNIFTKSFSFLLILFCALESFFSCNSQKSSDNQPLYLPVDTIIVYDMVEGYLNKLVDKDYASAFKMLSIVRKDTVHPISDSLSIQLLRQFQTLPVMKYERTSVDWTDIDPILFNYSITFAEFEDKSIPCTYNMTLQPIRKEGIWYLTFPGKLVNK